MQDLPYSFKDRFENEDGKQGTNPEELIAAAHGGCFNMALAVELEKEDITPDDLQTRATVNLDMSGDGPSIDKIHLDLEGTIPDVEESEFREIAEAAIENCPVSQLLKTAEITLDASLK